MEQAAAGGAMWLPPRSAQASGERERPPWEREALRAFANSRDSYFFRKEVENAKDSNASEGSYLDIGSDQMGGGKETDIQARPLDAEMAAEVCTTLN